jgi:hypothetical protein
VTKVIARTVCFVIVCSLTSTRTASSCSVVSLPGTPVTAQDWVRAASVIVRVRAATNHAVVPPPGSGGFGADGVPLAFIDFAILEVLKGQISETPVRLPGFLVDRDRFNKYPVPYAMSGDGVSCNSDFYKPGAEYLLILFRTSSGAYSARSALAPLNEQLHGPDDPWLRWVREEVGKLQRP